MPPPRTRECEQCGYDLSGFVEGESAPVCPECGHTFHPADIWAREPWPPLPAIAFRFFGATLGLGLLVALLSLTWWGQAFLAMGFFTLVFAWIASTVAIPLWQAEEIASRVAIRPRRWRVAAALATAGIAGNAMLSAALFWLLQRVDWGAVV